MPTLDFVIDTAKSMYDINVWGMICVTQVFTPFVIAAKGTMINTSSQRSLIANGWKGIYTGSKVAVTAISDTLRLELAPFGVKVVTVVTGAVRTNILSIGVNFVIPANSMFKSIEKEIAARAWGEDGTPRMETAVYAEKVVADSLGGANRQIWRGSHASIVRFTSNLFPASISVSLPHTIRSRRH